MKKQTFLNRKIHFELKGVKIKIYFRIKVYFRKKQIITHMQLACILIQKTFNKTTKIKVKNNHCRQY